MVGQTISHYRILSKLGEGGMGVVYRAEDERLRRVVALKFLPHAAGDEEARTRFVQEAQAASSLEHPNICAVHEIDETPDGETFIVMPCYEGESLQARIDRGPLKVAEAADIASQVAAGLAKAHEKGIVHRDIKPGNVFLTADGPVKILDFGLAKLRGQPQLTRPGATPGTLSYMSPEQLRGGEVDHRADIWSLGVVLYQMIAGELPFRGEYEQAIGTAILNSWPKPIRTVCPDVPADLARLIERALAKDPGRRPQTAAELAAALRLLKTRLESTSLQVAPAGAPDVPSIAVLPFTNLGADQDNEYFSDGITEDVIAQLSKLRTLRVISRTSVMLFKKRDVPLREIAARLGVTALLDGSVRRSGDRVRISAQLVDAETDANLWAETYDRRLDDIFAIQSDVAVHIATALKAELSSEERGRIAREPTRDMRAYQLYLQGRYRLIRFTLDGLRGSIDYFREAIERDPDYALAYTGLAMAYTELGEFGVPDREQVSREALDAAAKALELDPELGEAHGMMGYAKLVFEFDWARAEAEFKRALDLSPGSADAYSVYGRLCGAMGRIDEAVALQERAHELDPLTNRYDLATALLKAGRPVQAEQAALGSVKLDPEDPRGHATVGWALIKQGRADEGIAALERAVTLAPGSDMWLAQLGQAYGLIGRIDEARRILRELEDPSRSTPTSPYHLAYVLTGLGEHERALDCLERAVETRSGAVYGLKGSLLFAPLHAHPRFTALLKRMNLS